MKRAIGWIACLLTIACLFLLWQNAGLRRRVHGGDAPELQRSDLSDANPRGGDRPAPDDTRAIARRLTDELPPADATDEGMSNAAAWRHWLIDFFRPQAGEDLGAYRDRVLPVVKTVWDPQRDRVKRQRQRFESAARMTEKQRREIDLAVEEAGEALKDRLMQGILSEELMPGHVKPSTAVAFARDMLDAVDRANQRVRHSLDAEQLEALDASPFDVADYVLFATKWEDLLYIVP